MLNTGLSRTKFMNEQPGYKLYGKEEESVEHVVLECETFGGES